MDISLGNLYVDIGAERLKGESKITFNVSTSSPGLMIAKGMELLFCPKVVTQSLTDVSELIVEISSTLIFS